MNETNPNNPFAQQQAIPGIRQIIAVSSGKGGVGKSTITANLALALKRRGLKVGLLDADIYGPSLPRMFGVINQKPEIIEGNKLLPVVRYDVKLMSIGLLIDEAAAVVWRGPMLFKAIDQFLRDVQWGELDYLVVDMPPGTGDVPLTLAQKVPLAGAITISTPQNISLIDVKKAVDMYERLGVPVLGMVENMAYFVPPGQSERVQLFPKGQLDQFLGEKRLDKLVEIPFEPQIGLGSEAGVPVVESHKESATAQIFLKLADQIIAKTR